jgi:flagellar basal body P-ring formation protein FlgA
MVLTLLLIVSLCCGFPAALHGADPTVIDLKGETVVAGEAVTLADLAKIHGADASMLSDLPIMRSPGVRSGATLSARTIADKVRAGYHGPVFFTGADQVHISVRTVEVSKEALEKAFVDEIMKQSPWKGIGKIVVDDVKVLRCLTVKNAGPLRIQAKFSPHEDFLGPTVANLIITSGSSQERVTVKGTVKLFTDIPVVRTKIPAGRVISSADFEIRTMDLSKSPKAYTGLDGCVGKRARSTLLEGKPILPSQVECKPDVCSGDMVFIEARIDNLVVRDKGLALKDGYQGDPIPVKNVTSGKRVVGTIIAASLVQVEL